MTESSFEAYGRRGERRFAAFCALGALLAGLGGCGGDDGEPAGPGGGGGAARGGSGATPSGSSASGGGGSSSGGSGGDTPDRESSLTGLLESDCVARPNETVQWSDQLDQCQVLCAPGFADCDGQRTNGCEVSTSDASACGRCIDACLSDLCGSAPVCAAVQADLWTLGGGPRDIADLTVNAAGQLFAALDTSGVNNPMQAVPAVGSHGVVSSTDGTLAWIAPPGGTPDAVIEDSDAQLEATSAGVYLAEIFRSNISVGSETFSPAGGTDVLLSLFSFSGERLWSRALGIDGAGGISGLYADEDANVYLSFSARAGFTYQSFTLEDVTSTANVFFGFTPAGDFRWGRRVIPYATQPVSRGLFSSSSVVGDGWYSADTGEPATGVEFDGTASQAILFDSAGALHVVGRASSSQLHVRRGLPGLSAANGAPGVPAPNRDALYAAKYSASGQLLWETGFGHVLGDSRLHDVALTADGTLYVLASGTARSALAAGSELTHAFVARIGADGRQLGAWRLDVASPQAMALSLTPAGAVNVAIHYDGAVELPEPETGNGFVGGTLQFPAP